MIIDFDWSDHTSIQFWTTKNYDWIKKYQMKFQSKHLIRIIKDERKILKSIQLINWLINFM